VRTQDQVYVYCQTFSKIGKEKEKEKEREKHERYCVPLILAGVT
jgi:hypothetical protein